VSLAHLRGRSVRNPAFDVLRRIGLLPPALGYNAWLDSLGQTGTAGRVVPDPRKDATTTGRFRAALTAYATADPAREEALREDLRVAFRALGVRAPDEVSEPDFFAELLDSPWDRPELPRASRVQVLRLDGPLGPAALSFGDGATALDLSDLGGYGRPYRPAPPWAVREALHRPRRRVAGAAAPWPKAAGFR
jgi:hypothetical protein